MIRISIDGDERWRPAQTKGRAWKRHRHKKGKVSDSLAVEYCGAGAVGVKTQKKRRENLDCLAPLGKPLSIF